jgi:hypothetical protein
METTMRHDLPSHGHPARTVTRRLAWLAIGLAAATLTVIQVTGTAPARSPWR